MATVVVHSMISLKVFLLGRETSITDAIGVAVATLLLVSVLASRKLLQSYLVFKILALARYTGQSIEETILVRGLRYTFNGPPIIQVAYNNVSRLKLDHSQL